MATQEASRQNFRILFKSKWSTSRKKFKKSNEKDGIGYVHGSIPKYQMSMS